jgi:hypothetical protein
VRLPEQTPPKQRPLPQQVSSAGWLAGPGWYPDQMDPNLMLWFDGQRWTSGTALRNR